MAAGPSQARDYDGYDRVGLAGGLGSLDLPLLVVLRHKLRNARPCVFTAQHGQGERLATSLTVSRRRRVAIEFETWRLGRSGGASGSINFWEGQIPRRELATSGDTTQATQN
jgi:hypothetical protein